MSTGSSCGCTYEDEASKPRHDTVQILSSTRVPCPDSQRSIVVEIINRQQNYQVKKQEMFYLVSQSWYRSWKNYVEYDMMSVDDDDEDSSSSQRSATTVEQKGKSYILQNTVMDAEPEDDDGDSQFGPGCITNADLCAENVLLAESSKSRSSISVTSLLEDFDNDFNLNSSNTNISDSTLQDMLKSVKKQMDMEQRNVKDPGFSSLNKLRQLALLSDKLATLEKCESLTNLERIDVLTTFRHRNSSTFCKLKPPGSILEEVDFVILPETAWKCLHHWYGGGPELPRKAMLDPLDQTKYWIELYPLRVVIFDSKPINTPESNHEECPVILLEASPLMTVAKLKQMASLRAGHPYHKSVLHQLVEDVDSDLDAVNDTIVNNSSNDNSNDSSNDSSSSANSSTTNSSTGISTNSSTTNNNTTTSTTSSENILDVKDHTSMGSTALVGVNHSGERVKRSPAPTKVYSVNSKNIQHYSMDDTKTLEELGLVEDMLVYSLVIHHLLEHESSYYRNIYSGSSGYSRTWTGSSTAYVLQDQKGHTHPPGIAGLANLGNTCFINSVVQSLSAVPSFVNLTTSTAFSQQLANANMHNNSLMYQFVTILRKIWCGQYDVLAPYQLKKTIAKLAPQFAGYQQQDAQELLNFVLNQLNSELDILNKQKIENNEQHKVNEEVGVDIAPIEEEKVDKQETEIYDTTTKETKETKETINSMFGGSWLSTTTCCNCNETSSSTEPFNTIQVSNSIPQDRLMRIRLLKWSSSAVPERVAVLVPCEGRVRDLMSEVASLCNVNESSMSLCCTRVDNGRIRDMLWRGTEMLRDLRENDDIVMYEIPTFKKLRLQQLRSLSTASSSSTDSIHSISLLPETETVIESVKTSVGKKKRVRRKEYNVLQVCSSSWNTPLLIDLPRSMAISNTDLYQKISRRTGLSDCSFKAYLIKQKKETIELFASALNDSSSSEKENILTKDDLQSAYIDIKFESTTLENTDEKNQSLSIWRLPATTNHSRYDEIVVSYASSKRVTLNDLIDIVEKPEYVRWKCPKCAKDVATKTMSIHELPPYLIFHVKRIVVHPSGKDGNTSLRTTKDDSIVDMPLYDLAVSTGSGIADVGTMTKTYQLISTIDHVGTSFGGHYTATSLCRNTHAWHKISDDSCSVVSRMHGLKGTKKLAAARASLESDDKESDKIGNENLLRVGFSDDDTTYSSSNAVLLFYAQPEYVTNAMVDNPAEAVLDGFKQEQEEKLGEINTNEVVEGGETNTMEMSSNVEEDGLFKCTDPALDPTSNPVDLVPSTGVTVTTQSGNPPVPSSLPLIYNAEAKQDLVERISQQQQQHQHQQLQQQQLQQQQQQQQLVEMGFEKERAAIALESTNCFPDALEMLLGGLPC